MNPKISIIIPIYKVEKYIRRCLDTVLKQSLQDIEVILVDDGSPDRCGQICDEYASKDSRIKVIHKQNEGVSAARNSGLKLATGEYIGFVDADDYIAQTMFEDLYCQAILANAEVAMCQFTLTDGKEDTLSHKSSYDDCEIFKFNREEAFKVIADFSIPVQVTVWNKIYKKELIEGLWFDTSKIMAEDLEFLMRALVRSKRVVYIPYALYAYYAQREGAATYHADHDMSWYLEQNKNITSIMDEFACECKSLKKLAVGYKCVNGDLSIANALARSGKLDHEAICVVKQDLKKNFICVMSSELHLIKKAQMILFLISPKMYIIVMRKIVKVSLGRNEND